MRHLFIHTIILLLLTSPILVAQKKSYPFDSNNWLIEDKNGEIQQIDLTTFDNKACLHLPIGQIAYLKDSSYRDFKLEMDIAGSIIPGFGFRGADKRNFEYLYLRVISDNQNDALQYLPIYNGGFSWQLYNYPDYEAIVQFPKKYLFSIDTVFLQDLIKGKLSDGLRKLMLERKIKLRENIDIKNLDIDSWKVIDFGNKNLVYFQKNNDSIKVFSGLAWIHLKVEVIDKKATIYIEDMNSPKLTVNDLKHNVDSGLISLRNFFADSYYANVAIERINHKTSSPDKLNDSLSLNYLTDWKASNTFIRNESMLQIQIDSIKENTSDWLSITSETSGLINLSRYYAETSGTVLLKTSIHSVSNQKVQLFFDYADHLAISLNSKIVFSNPIRFRNNEGRVIDGEEKIDLQLEKGDNELLFVITADKYNQNWGFIAKYQ